MYPELIDIS